MDNNKKRIILAIDLKSFYASVECVSRGLDPFTTPLVVADLTRGKGTIILAVTPYLKTLGIPSRLRLYDLPNIPNMIYATPRMEYYIKKSVEVINVYLNYVAYEDMHIYSVDEAFLDVTNYLKAANCTKEEYAKRIINEVYKKTGLTVTAGIGSNLFMAKAAMDIEAKHNKDFLASWEEKDIPSKLWKVTPLTKMWGIGERMEKRLNALGMYQVGDIAVADRWYLKSLFGVAGEEIWEHANGIDEARIQNKYIPSSSSLSVGQVLFKDYSKEQALTIIKESGDELINRLLKSHRLVGGLCLYIGYSSNGGGFAKAMKLENPTDDTRVIQDAIKTIFMKNYDNESFIRNVCVNGFDLTDNSSIQLSLFDEGGKKEEDKENFYSVVEKIRKMYGLKSLLYASSMLEESNALRRADQIGGHRK